MNRISFIDLGGYLNLNSPEGAYRCLRLKPNPDAEHILHQYGGLCCLQFAGNFEIEDMRSGTGKLVRDLIVINDEICAYGWGDDAPKGTEERISKLLGVECLRAQEGLFQLANGDYIALENCD